MSENLAYNLYDIKSGDVVYFKSDHDLIWIIIQVDEQNNKIEYYSCHFNGITKHILSLMNVTKTIVAHKAYLVQL